MSQPNFKEGMYTFCLHCFSTLHDAVKHHAETGHNTFIHDGVGIDLAEQSIHKQPQPEPQPEPIAESDKPV